MAELSTGQENGRMTATSSHLIRRQRCLLILLPFYTYFALSPVVLEHLLCLSFIDFILNDSITLKRRLD